MQLKEETVYLKNYTEFIECSSAIITSIAENEKTAVVYADITGFQLINDYHGFSEGDRFLKKLGMFLKELPGTKACARVFSDHFLVLGKFTDDIDMNELVLIYEDMLNDFLEQQCMFHSNCKVSIACGCCMLEDGDNTLVKAIDDANLARKEAKGVGHTSVTLFNDAMREKIRKQKDTQVAIQSAFREQEFIFYLQPKINLRSGKIIGAEALARWIKKDGTMVYPDDFIPIMEKDGSVVELDFTIYREVCVYIRERMKNGKVLMPISVNMSRIHIGRRDFAEKIHKVAQEYGIPPYLLEFELTETVLLDEFNSTKKVIDDLRKYGYKISIDDFGTGFTGVNIWKELDFDVVKLDKTFISENVLEMQRNDTIITSITYVGKKMQTALLCEGVETMEQCWHMKELGNEIAQGFYFSRPISTDAFDVVLAENKGYFSLPWAENSQGELAPEYLETEEISPTQMRSITRSLIHIMPCGMAGFDENSGKLLFLSDKVLEMLDYARGDFIGSKDQKWMDKMFPLNQNSAKSMEYRERFVRDGYISVKYSVPNKNGVNIYIDMYGARVSTPEFGAYVLCCFFNDTERRKAILMAAESENKLDSLIQTFHAGIAEIVLEGDFKIIKAADSYYEMIGYSKEEVSGSPFFKSWKNILADDFREVKVGIDRIISGEKNHLEYQMQKKDGSMIWNAIYITSVRKKDNHLIGEILFLDITRDKEMEKMSEQLDMVVENTPGDIAVIRVKEGNLNIQYLTTGIAKMSGYTKEEFDLILKEDNGLKLIAKEDRKAILNQVLCTCAAREQIGYNFRFVNKDGTIHWHNVAANYSHTTADGEVVYHGIFTNIDLLKLQEEAIERSEMRYRAAAELAKTDIWSYDFRLKTLELPATEERSRLKLNGKKNLSLKEFIEEGHIHPDYLEDYFGIYKKIEAGSDQEEAQLLAQTIDGEYQWFKLKCKVVAWGDTREPLEMIGVSENIHMERRNKEQINQLKSLALKDSLTGCYHYDATSKLIEERLKQIEAGGWKAAFLMMDIDNFRAINETFGHQTGNMILVNICKNIKKLLPAESIMGRIGGDEFIIFIDKITGESGIYRLADEICETAEKVLHETMKGMTISMGISFAEKEESFGILYQLAEEAMFKVKRKE